MRINPKETILNIPILKVRDLLKSYVNSPYYLSADSVAYRLKISEEQAHTLIGDLRNRGWISNSDIPFEDCWMLTNEGVRFATASARPPIKRKTADRLLTQFLDRVHEVNAEPYFLYRIAKVVLFGSYLSHAQEMSDVDLLIYLEPNEADPDEHWLLCQERNHELLQEGKRVSLMTIEFFPCNWPQKEVYQHLRGKSRALSLHSPSDEFVLAESEYKIIFHE